MKNLYKQRYKMIMLCGVLSQFILLCYCNFTRIESSLDYDSSLAIRHAVDMWRGHTIFLKDFIYTTSMEIDCASFFAAPIYILTGNLSLSMGIVHLFLNAILIAAIYILLNNLNVPVEGALLGIILVMTPYAYGQLSYTNMLFFSVGQYGFRLLSVLLLLDLLTYKGNYKRLFYIVGFILEMLVLFWTALSTGTYLLVSLLVPLLICFIIDIIKGNKYNERTQNGYVIFFCIISVFWGNLLNKIMNVEIHSNDYLITSAKDFFNTLFDAVSGVFVLFEGLGGSGTSVFSISGFNMIVKFIFTLCIIIIPIVSYFKQHDKKKDCYLFPIVACLVIVNFFIVTYAQVNYGGGIFPARYHIIWAIPLLILNVVCIWNWMKEEKNVRLKNAVLFMMTFGIILINTLGFNSIIQLSDEIYLKQREVLKTADDLDVDSIIVYSDLQTAHILNALDIDKNVRGYFKADNATIALDTWGNFANANINPHHLMVVSRGKETEIPIERLNAYEKVSDIGDWGIYVTDNCIW